MEKVIYLEFEKDCSLDEIKTELLYYRSINQVACTDIRGERVFSDDENIQETFERISLGIPKKYSEKYIRLVQKRKFIQEDIVHIELMKHDKAFTFYYKLSKKLVREELLEDYEKNMLLRYDMEPTIIVVIAQLLLALEQPTEIECLNCINKILESLKSDSQYEHKNKTILEIAINDVITYGKKGKLLTLLFSEQVFEDISSFVKIEEEQVERKINELAKKPK